MAKKNPRLEDLIKELKELSKSWCTNQGNRDYGECYAMSECSEELDECLEKFELPKKEIK